MRWKRSSGSQSKIINNICHHLGTKCLYIFPSCIISLMALRNFTYKTFPWTFRSSHLKQAKHDCQRHAVPGLQPNYCWFLQKLLQIDHYIALWTLHLIDSFMPLSTIFGHRRQLLSFFLRFFVAQWRLIGRRLISWGPALVSTIVRGRLPLPAGASTGATGPPHFLGPDVQ